MDKLTQLIKTLYAKYRNFILYCLIGVINTCVDLGVFTLLQYMGMHYLVANIISYHCGIVCSFLLNRMVNFKIKDKPMRRFLSFYGISLVAVAVSEVLLYLLVSVMGLHSVVAKLISMVIIAICQFLFVKHFTFRK
ncbi:MAG: GtrA family protein [Bacteroidales bacterium]|nr:GtrA family protein [Bacteroidales bacterium]